MNFWRKLFRSKELPMAGSASKGSALPSSSSASKFSDLQTAVQNGDLLAGRQAQVIQQERNVKSVAIDAVVLWLNKMCAHFEKPRYFQIDLPNEHTTMQLLGSLSFVKRTDDTFTPSTKNITDIFLLVTDDGRCRLNLGGEFTHDQQQELLRRIKGWFQFQASSLNPDDFSDPREKREATRAREEAADQWKQQPGNVHPGMTIIRLTSKTQAHTLLQNKDIRSWYDKVTAGYTDPVFIMILIPTTAERLAQDLGSFLEPLCFVGTGRDNQIVIKSDTIAPFFVHKLGDDQWALCLCGGFTKQTYTEIFDAIRSKKYISFAVGKDTTRQTTIYP